MTDDLESRRIRAEEARQFLSNPLFREAFDGVARDLLEVSLTCDPDNKDKAQRIVISQQLLQAVRREIERKVNDGEFAAFQMAELDKRKKLFQFRR